MPKVPLAHNLATRRPMTDAKFQSFAHGGEAIAAGVQSFGGGLGHLAETLAEEEARKRKERIDDMVEEAAAKRADVSLAHLEARQLHGPDGPLQDPTKDARTAAAEASAFFEGAAKQLLSHARTPMERALGRQAIKRRRQEIAAGIGAQAEARARDDALAVSKMRQTLAAQAYVRKSAIRSARGTRCTGSSPSSGRRCNCSAAMRRRRARLAPTRCRA